MAKKVRGSSRYFFIFILILLVMYFMYLGISGILKRMSFFKIQSIVIKGNENLDKTFLLSLVSDFSDRNIFTIKKDEVETKYTNVVRIKDIKIKKYLPHKLVIIIKERKGEFFIKSKEGILMPIDNEKMVLDNDRIYQNEVFPIIDTQLKINKDIEVGKKVKNEFIDSVYSFVDSLNKIDPQFIHTISEFYKNKNDIVMIDRFTGNKIIFGKGNIRKKVQRYLHIRNVMLDNRDKKYKIVLKWNNDAVISPEEN